jgi:hypothetical protein
MSIKVKDFNPNELLIYGNQLEISGFVMGNGQRQDIILFPDEFPVADHAFVLPTQEQMSNLLYQLDVLGIGTNEKKILRKSHRQIDSDIIWAVYRRDNYKCRYCGRNNVPLSVDHVVLWENGGDSLLNNMLSACRKCNKTRGNTEYLQWLLSDYYNKVNQNLTPLQKQENEDFWLLARDTPKRPTMRSR